MENSVNATTRNVRGSVLNEHSQQFTVTCTWNTEHPVSMFLAPRTGDRALRREAMCWYEQRQWKKKTCVNCQHQIATRAANLLPGRHSQTCATCTLTDRLPLYALGEEVQEEGLGITPTLEILRVDTRIRKDWPSTRWDPSFGDMLPGEGPVWRIRATEWGKRFWARAQIRLQDSERRLVLSHAL